MGHAPLTELSLRLSAARVLTPSPGLFLLPAAPQSGDREPRYIPMGPVFERPGAHHCYRQEGRGSGTLDLGIPVHPTLKLPVGCTLRACFPAVKWHSHGVSSGSENWTTAPWHRTNGSNKHTAPTRLTIVTNSWPCEGSTGIGAGRWRGLEPRPPGEPLDSGTSVPQSEQCKRTSPHWAPDQRQKCVALTLSSGLKLRQAGRWGAPGLDTRVALRVSSCQPVQGLPPPPRESTQHPGVGFRCHLIYPWARQNRTVS